MIRREAKIEIRTDGTTVRRYSLRSLTCSSHKLGPCQVCHGHASEVYRLDISIRYEDSDFPGGFGWTYAGAPLAKYGHESCLELSKEGHEVKQ